MLKHKTISQYYNSIKKVLLPSQKSFFGISNPIDTEPFSEFLCNE